MTRIWQTWLVIWCWAVGLFGLVFVGSGWTVTSGPAMAILEVMNGPKDLALEPTLQFSLGIVGAITLGWSLTLLGLVRMTRQLEISQARELWLGVTVAVLVWFVLDSSLSVATGFWLNAVSNTLFLVAFLIPMRLSGVLGLQMTSVR
ncbi:MAG: hypothetical protein AAFU71_13895 [Cyanobacteria bacterium J06632_22]